MEEILAEQLYDRHFYSELINKWRDYYFKVNKVSGVSPELNYFSDVKSLTILLMNVGVNSLGYDSCVSLIKNARPLMKNKMVFTRILGN